MTENALVSQVKRRKNSVKATVFISLEDQNEMDELSVVCAAFNSEFKGLETITFDKENLLICIEGEERITTEPTPTPE